MGENRGRSESIAWAYIVQVGNALLHLVQELPSGLGSFGTGVKLGPEGLTELPDLGPELLALTEDDEDVLVDRLVL